MASPVVLVLTGLPDGAVDTVYRPVSLPAIALEAEVSVYDGEAGLIALEAEADVEAD